MAAGANSHRNAFVAIATGNSYGKAALSHRNPDTLIRRSFVTIGVALR